MARRGTWLWWMIAALGIWATGPEAAAKPLVDQTRFGVEAAPPWEVWSPRDEISPAFAVDGEVSRTGEDGSLRIRCSDAAQWGGWTLVVEGVKAGTWYRFDAYYRPGEVVQEHRTVLPRLDWLNSQGGRAGQPEFVYHTEEAAEGWRHVWALAPAPEEAARVRLELFFGWSPGGTVWWDDVSFGPADPPKPRLVKVAAIYHRPEGNSSAQENVEEFCRWIGRAASSKPDIIVLPEGMTMVGTPLSSVDVAEPIPGPTSRRMGEMAREHGCYIVACYNEREGSVVYNTAILVDRSGELVGKYRKLYIPRNEVTDGITPGTETPVFGTDFGKVGMMICWDVQYPEPAQRMALKGAEIIFLPIWGGNESLVKARAIENHVFLVTSGYDIASMVIDPEGRELATAPVGAMARGTSIAVAEVDLNRRYVDWWDGHLRGAFMKEWRDDL